MWLLESPGSDTTNKIMIPNDGIIDVTKPEGVEVCPYINGVMGAVHHIHVKAGDEVYFKLKGTTEAPATVTLGFNGGASNLEVPAMVTTPVVVETNYEPGVGDDAILIEENNMTPAETINLFAANPGMGYSGVGAGAGAGLGAGLLGGVLGGALLGGNRGGLFGGNGNGDGSFAAINTINSNTDNAIAATERLTAARFDAEAQREIQAAIERTAAATQLATAVQSAALGVEIAKGQGEISTQVALAKSDLSTQGALNASATQVLAQKGFGDLSTQNALTASATQVLVQKAVGDLAVQTALGDARTQADVALVGTANALAFKDVALQTAAQTYALSQAVKAEGDLTRGLINKLNDDTLNRLLTTAQNEIIELRGDRDGNRRSRETEINVTQSVNQNQNNLQAQAQQQQQFQILANLAAQVGNLANDIQVVRQTQSNVNFGTQGTAGQTASAANTRVN
jgi:hypothetical protein